MGLYYNMKQTANETGKTRKMTKMLIVLMIVAAGFDAGKVKAPRVETTVEWVTVA